MRRVLVGVLFGLLFYQSAGLLLLVRYVNASGETIEIPTNRITSDFGHRFSTWSNGSWSPSPWHKGIDYAPCNCSERSLVAIASGKVEDIYLYPGGFIILVINGGTWNEDTFIDDDNDFANGDVFNDNNLKLITAIKQ